MSRRSKKTKKARSKALNRYKGVVIPRCNGYAQLWARGSCLGGLRIIYPDGDVLWITDRDLANFGELDEVATSCTSRDTQLDAIKATIDHDADQHNWDNYTNRNVELEHYTETFGVPEFLGYL